MLDPALVLEAVIRRNDYSVIEGDIGSPGRTPGQDVAIAIPNAAEDVVDTDPRISNHIEV
jgi:hypothetical protein